MLTEVQQKTVAEEAAKVAETFGLAKGVKPENVQRRVNAFIANGVEPLLARTLAIEAENTQVVRDGQSAQERDNAEEEARLAIGKKVLRMNKTELLAFASENGIAIAEDASTNAQILAIIQAALAAAK